MEKLSSILPSNNRITTVDTMAARAVRPGVEGYGAPTASHERRPTLAASDMLNISKPAQELANQKVGSERLSDKSIIKETENLHYANRRADIANRDQMRAETHEVAHAYEPDEKMHIADDLVNVPAAKIVPKAGGAPSMAATVQMSSHEGILPRTVERLQSRTMNEPGSRLSLMA